MNNLNQIEQKLRSWTPRRPSAKYKSLKQQTAAGVPVEDVFSDIGPMLRRWLVPGTALLAALITFNARNTQNITTFVSSPSTGLVAAVAMAEPNMVTYASVDRSDRNLITGNAVFDWTNGSHSLTTAVPVTSRETVLR